MFPVDVRCQLDKDAVTAILGNKVKGLGLRDDALSSVVIAADDDSDYGECIRRSRGFSGGETHSHGGAGKTLPYRATETSVSCDLVFPKFVFTELVEGDVSSEDHKLLDYVVGHEMAHAFDYSTRRILHPHPLADFGGSIEEVGSYWGPLLLSEFAASFLAGRFISSEQYKMIASNSVQAIEHGMTALGTFKLHVYWNVLVEQSKIAGNSFALSDQSEPAYQRWARIGSDIVSELEAFVEELRALMKLYPRWSEEGETKWLTARCYSLFAAMNVG